jgi:hypothetical protein
VARRELPTAKVTTIGDALTALRMFARGTPVRC